MKVLVAVDRNPETFVGLRYACHLLENCNARIEALHVRPALNDIAAESYAPFLSKDGLEEAIERETQEITKQFREHTGPCSAAGIRCSLDVATGDAADEILSMAQTEGHDLIVLGSHEESYLKGFLLGTVHAKILHYARQPVLIVRQFREIRKVLVAYRGSGTDDAAVHFASSLLLPKRPELTLLHVQETGKSESDEFARACLQKGAEILRQSDYDPITKMAKGEFVEEILKNVAVHRYDLIVLGAYGHNRPKYKRLISDEALNLARLTTRPILVFRDVTTVD
ncbi:MAG TPA: universal stress protein [Desulfomonilaceae bacterium]|nr:universal stress protein [Desulfomonilaceae bacterium]